jgi:hypothetical protein
MEQFIIQPESSWFTNPITNTRQRGLFISKSIKAYYHTDYHGGGMWSTQGSIENMIWTLKNDVSPFPQRLSFVKKQFRQVLLTDLPQILQTIGRSNLTICVIPRSKRESYYSADQLFFRQIVSRVIGRLNGFFNGTRYIIRHTDTRTTHLDRNGEGGAGNLPYPGITAATCTISDEVRGKDILLIDDLYTKSVNIDEDAIQALLDKGANSVIFYAVGRTVSRNL